MICPEDAQQKQEGVMISLRSLLATARPTPEGSLRRGALSPVLVGSALALALALAGCSSSSKVSGTYHQAAGGGVITLEFSGGKVTSTIMGQSSHGTYEVKGDQVIMHLPGEGDVSLKINGDGTLDSPLGTFKKG
jgi:hypothetical protein